MIALPVDVATALRATADWAQVAVSELITEAVTFARDGRSTSHRRMTLIDHTADLWQDVTQDLDRGAPVSLVNVTLAADLRDWIQERADADHVGSGPLLLPWIESVLGRWMPGFGIGTGDRFRVTPLLFDPVVADGSPVDLCAAGDRAALAVARTVAAQLSTPHSLSDIHGHPALPPEALAGLTKSGVDIGAVALRLLLSRRASSEELLGIAIQPLLTSGYSERVAYVLRRLEDLGIVVVEREAGSHVPKRTRSAQPTPAG